MPIVDGHLVIDGYTYAGGDGSSKENAIEVSTFKQLMDADDDITTSTQAQRYIKITADLYPSHEDWFTGFVTKYNWRAYIFCDENNRKKIDGLIVSANEYITTDRASAQLANTFENVDILNGVLYRTSIAAIFGASLSGNSAFALLFRNSTVSLRVASQNNTNSYITNKNCQFTGCSLYIQFGSDKPQLASLPLVGAFYQSNIVIESATLSSMTFNYNCFFQQSSFIFKNCHIATAFLSNISINWQPPQTYFATINCTYSTTFSIYTQQKIIVASDATPYPFTLSTSSGNNAILATTVDSTDPNFDTSSVKSKQFMLDSGFLP